MDDLAARIAFLRLGLGLTQEEFRDAINEVLKELGSVPVTRGAVSNWELGGKGIATRNLRAISKLTGATRDWIEDKQGEPPRAEDLRAIGRRVLGTASFIGVEDGGDYPETIHVYGQAAGSALDQGAVLLFDQEPIARVPMLPGLVGMRDVYALEVTGESMLPMFRPQEPIYVSPHSSIRKDDPMVVIEHRSRNGNPVAFLKLMVADRKGAIVGRQLNPPMEIEYQKRTGVSAHKVLSLKEALGYSGVNVEPQNLPPLRLRRGPRH